MFRSWWWFHRLLGTNSRRNRRRLGAQQRRTVRPTLEGLEDRITPSALPVGTPTINVTNGGPVTNTHSLAHAIQQVDNAPTQPFILNIANDITLTQNNPVLTNPSGVDLVGNGHTITIGSGVQDRLFTVKGGTVYFSNLTLTGGKISGTGGLVANTANNGAIKTTTVTQGLDGGGAIAEFGGAVSLTNATIRGNSAYAATSSAPGIAGGGIFINGGGAMVLNGTNTISSNSALAQTLNTSTPVAAAQALGGGVYLSSSSFTVSPATSTVNSTLVMTKNIALGGTTPTSGIAAAGGALADVGGQVRLTKTQIGGATSASGNTVGVNQNVSATTAGSAVFGAGIVAVFTGDFTIVNSSVTFNSATGGGSTAATGGAALGGGLAVFDAGVNALDTTFAGNSVTAGQSGANSMGFGAGGAVAVTVGGAVNLTNDTIVNNTATGNGATSTTNPVVAAGGGVASTTFATPTLLNSIVQDNTANGKAMDIFGSLGTGSEQDIISTINGIAGGATSTTTNDQTVLSGFNHVFVTPTLQVATTPSLSTISTAVYYPLVTGSLAVNNANPAANNTLATAEHITTDATFDEAGFARTANNGASMDIGPVQLNANSPVAPKITTQPTDQTGLEGGSVTFTAAVNGNPNPPVQWQVSSDGGKTFTTVSGATSDTLALSNLTLNMSGNEYEAVFTNSVGTATSNPATLTVNPTTAPTITTNPKPQTGTVGGSVTFTAAASGTPTPTVSKWEVSSDGGKTFTTISGATGPTLTLTNLTFNMTGNEYEAVFSNSAGTATTNPAILTVNATTAPSITTPPTPQTKTAGGSVTFTAAASNATSVQWQVSVNGGTFMTITGNASAATDTLTLSNVSSSMNGNKYEAVFTNNVGSTTTNAATLTVNTTPTVIVIPSNQTVAAGQTATFTAVVTGNPTATLQWEFSSNGGASFTPLGQTGTTLTLSNVTSAMSGLYEAIATNSVGSTTSNTSTLNVTSSSSTTSPSTSPSSSSSTTQLTPLQAAAEMVIDVAAIVLQLNGNTTQLALLSSLAHSLVPGFTLETSLAGLVADAQAAYTLAGPLGVPAVQAGISFVNSSSSGGV